MHEQFEATKLQDKESIMSILRYCVNKNVEITIISKRPIMTFLAEII